MFQSMRRVCSLGNNFGFTWTEPVCFSSFSKEIRGFLRNVDVVFHAAAFHARGCIDGIWRNEACVRAMVNGSN